MRECFEESGILLAKRDGELVELGEQEREEGRRAVHGGKVKFGEWVESQKGATPDLGMVPRFPLTNLLRLPPSGYPALVLPPAPWKLALQFPGTGPSTEEKETNNSRRLHPLHKVDHTPRKWQALLNPNVPLPPPHQPPPLPLLRSPHARRRRRAHLCRVPSRLLVA